MIALILGAVIVAYLLLASGDDPYKVRLRFQNAAQLVNGNQVKLSGSVIGTVTKIELADNGEAEVHVEINEDVAPLREGTRAIVRWTSLSGIANRYIDIRAGPPNAAAIPNNGVITRNYTVTAVDLDEIFNVFDPETREGLSNVFRGFGRAYAGRGEQARRGFPYLNPTLVATRRLLEELNRDTPQLRRFINRSEDLVTDIADRRDDLAALISNLAITTGAINNERDALADAIAQLPGFMRRANTTFVNLRATLDDLDGLVEDSKPVARKLRPFLAELRPLARDAVPTFRNLTRLIHSPGAHNDLIGATRLNVPLRRIAIGPVQVNGANREGAFPASTRALAGATPELAYVRPYTPDLLGWFDDYSRTGIYDALGGVSRVALNVNLFTIANGLPTGIIIPPEDRAAIFAGTAALGQYNRCPGSVERPRDGSSPFKPTPDYNCDETQLPPGE